MMFLKLRFAKTLQGISVFLVLIMVSCAEEELATVESPILLLGEARTELLTTVDEGFLEASKGALREFSSLYGLGDDIFEGGANLRRSSDKIYSGLRVNIYKISTTSPHPDGSGENIQISGVVLIPKYKDRLVGFNRVKIPYRIRFVAPFTYTSNVSAPSVAFGDIFGIANPIDKVLPFTMISQAWTGKYAVFIPDYPGFGDSFGDCFPPFVNKDAHNRSNYDFLMAGIERIEGMGYELKDEILVQGYSQGAFSAVQFTRYLETNDLIQVKALSAGGTPAILDELINEARMTDLHPHTFFLPYAYFGLYENNQIDLDPGRVIQLNKFAPGQQYADFDEVKNLYAGDKSIVQLQFAFPNKIDKLLTHDFLNADANDTGSEYNGLFQALRQNSIEPWNNRCQFRMYHGKLDNAVYVRQAHDYYQRHLAASGAISFDDTIGEHIAGYLPYLLKTDDWFWDLR